MKKCGIKTRDAERVLRDNGFCLVSQKGSHRKYRHELTGRSLVITMTSNGVNLMVWRRLKKEFCIKE